MKPIVVFLTIFSVACLAFLAGCDSKPTLKKKIIHKIEAKVISNVVTSVTPQIPTCGPNNPCPPPKRNILDKLKHPLKKNSVAVSQLSLYEPKGAYMIPTELRHRNYGPSCGYASLQNVLEVFQLTPKALEMRSKFYGPVNPPQMSAACEAIGVRYSQGSGADGLAILEFADRTGRAAAMFFKSAHVCVFCGYDKQGRAVVLDPNSQTNLDPNGKMNLEYWPKEQFLAEWKSRGAFASVILEQPVPGRSM